MLHARAAQTGSYVSTGQDVWCIDLRLTNHILTPPANANRREREPRAAAVDSHGATLARSFQSHSLPASPLLSILHGGTLEGLSQFFDSRSTEATGTRGGDAPERATEEPSAHQQKQMVPATPPTNDMKVSYGSAEWVASPPQKPASNALVQWKVVRCHRIMHGLHVYCTRKFFVGSNSTRTVPCSRRTMGPMNNRACSATRYIPSRRKVIAASTFMYALIVEESMHICRDLCPHRYQL